MYLLACRSFVGCVRQLSKLNSKQYRSYRADKNGPGGSGTHDRSTRLSWSLLHSKETSMERKPTFKSHPLHSFFFASSVSLCPFKRGFEKVSHGSKIRQA